MPSKSKRLRIRVGGHDAVALLTWGELTCMVEVTTAAGKARSTCKPNHWRILAASLVMRIYHEHPGRVKLPKTWLLL